MRILITGATGFVGRHLVRRLAEQHELISLQRRPSPVDARIGIARADLEQATPEEIVDAIRAVDVRPIDAVVHLAARLDNPFGRDYGLTELAATNVRGTMALLEVAAHLGARRFVYGSTGGVGTNPPPGGLMRESDPPGPVNPYGLTKHLGEQAVLAYRWPFVRLALRYFAPYGRDGSNPMFHHLIERLERGEPIDLPADGGATLNPIHVDDAVSATEAALAIVDPPAAVNVAGPDIVTMRELIDLLGEALGRTPVVRPVDGPSLNWAADIALQSAVLGAPRVGLREGIRREFGPSTAAAAASPL